MNIRAFPHIVFALSVTLGLGGCLDGQEIKSTGIRDKEAEPEVIPSDSSNKVTLLFNEVDGSKIALNDADGYEFHVTNNFNSPERVPGIEGTALRTDGYSTWVEGPLLLGDSHSLSVQTWVALENYPGDHEVPHNDLTPSALFQQSNATEGFSLDINTFGQWSFHVTINDTVYNLKAPELFPLYEWVHVAAVVDGNEGNIRLYLNGQEVAVDNTIPSNGTINFTSTNFTLGKGYRDAGFGIFSLINGINGVFDQTKIYTGARSHNDISEDYNNDLTNISSTAEQALKVPVKRFINDLQRPTFHSMPDSAWTNEPHGLVEFKGKYHMFYQGTPNGPFKTQTLWGHTVSDDFVHWENQKNALIPSLENSDTVGYDMKGIWAGDVVVENDVAYAFYTNVNHTGPFNPGIAVAISSDDNLEHWQKMGPIIDTSNVDDFRDPYLFKDGDTWHMLIGAKVNGSGGLDHYTSNDISNMDSWVSAPFSTVDYAEMDTGSDVWELPVFEPIGNGKHILVMNPIGGSLSRFSPNPVRTVYWIGTWQNGLFTPDFTTPKNFDVIHGHLSPTAERNADGDLVSIGIVDERRDSQAQLDAGWAHTYSLPRVWGLASDNATLTQKADPSLSSLRIMNSAMAITNQVVNGQYSLGSRGRSVEIIAQVDSSNTAQNYGVVFAASTNGSEMTKLYYDVANQQIVLDKSASSLAASSQELSELRGNYDENVFGKPEKFHVFIDHSVIDVFINDKAAFSARIYPTLADSEQIELYSPSAETTFTSVQVWQLENIGDKRSYLTLSDDGEIIEAAENGEVVTVNLVNNTFVDELNVNNWHLSNLPTGVTLSNLTRLSDTQASFILLGNSSVDFDQNINNVVLSVAADQLAEASVSDPLLATGIVIRAITEIVSEASLSTNADIYEGNESGQQITVSLVNNSFVEPINIAYWTANNLPTGLTFSVNLIDVKTAMITLEGQSDSYINADIHSTFTISSDALVNVDPELGSGSLTSAKIVFKARVVNVVSVADDAYEHIVTSFDSATEMLSDGWSVTGAFGLLNTADAWQGTTQDSAAAKVGTRALSTCEMNNNNEGCDEPIGTLTSTVLKVIEPYLYGLIGGGNGNNSVGVRIMDSIGNVLFTYTPNSCGPSFVDNNDDWTTFDVRAVVGANVRFQIFDEEASGCGFVSAEHFYQSSRSPTSSDGQLPETLINGGTLVLTEQAEQALSYNVSLPYADSDQVVIGRFDDAQQMITDGWLATGVFATPSDGNAWSGTARNLNTNAARVGAGAVSTCEINNNSEGCDASVGSLTSPNLTVENDTPFLSFLMSGGNGSSPVGLEVLDAIDDSIIANYIPNSCGPSYIDGDDDWVTIDLSEHVGQQIKIRIFDEESGGCGFVSFDHLHFSSGTDVDPTTVDFNTLFADVSEPSVDESLVNVTVTNDAFIQVIGSFDDAQQMLINGWTATGMFSNPESSTAWQGTARNSNDAVAYVGLGAVGTCELPNPSAGCDSNTGTLTSPTFKVDSDRTILNFLMAGGNGSAAVGLQVLSADTNGILESFVPNTCSPSYIDGDDDWQHIDLSAYVGRFVKVHIYDNETGACGFVSFDHLSMSAYFK